MTNLPAIKNAMLLPLSDEEKDAVFEHLRKGGNPTTTAAVTGISTERLMEEFREDPFFNRKVQMVRAQALAEIEYKLMEIAKGDSNNSLKAIQLMLSTQMAELYSSSSEKLEKKIQKIVEDR